MTTYTIKPLSREELQALRNMGNECEAAADEIDRYRAALEQIMRLPSVRQDEANQIAARALESQ